MGSFDGEIPNIIFLLSAIGFWFLAYIQNKKYGKTIETYFLTVLAILFSLSYFVLIFMA
tara:strand:- start:212 stop:388 length:177 start_codon:yes stop_codon:yes gene_type:complete